MEYLTVKEVAQALKVTPRTLYSWRAAGQIAFTKIGGTRNRISRQELERFISGAEG